MKIKNTLFRKHETSPNRTNGASATGSSWCLDGWEVVWAYLRAGVMLIALQKGILDFDQGSAAELVVSFVSAERHGRSCVAAGEQIDGEIYVRQYPDRPGLRCHVSLSCR